VRTADPPEAGDAGVGPGSGSGGDSGLLDLASHGITADGTTDNSTALAAAVIYAQTNGFAGIRLPVGVTQCASAVCLDLSGVSDFVVAGWGATSVLRMNKDFVPDRALILLAEGSSRVVLRDFTADGNWADESGNEQVHLVVCGKGTVEGGAVDAVTIQRVWFRDCKGDAIRLLGFDGGGEVSGVLVDACRFTNADRCGVAVQRGTYDVHITNSYFEGGSDQQLDMEATDASGVGRYVVAGNTFDGTGRAVSTNLVTLGGADETHPNVGTIFSNNVVRGRVQVTNVVGLRFIGNQVIPEAEDTSEPVVNFIRVCEDVAVQGNHFERAVGATAGRVIQFSQNTDLVPNGIAFIGNTVVQRTNSESVLFDGADNAVAIGNIVKYYGDDDGTHDGIVLDATLGDLESFVAIGNTIIGELGGGTLLNGVHCHCRDVVVERVVVSDNAISGVDVGVQFEAGAGSYGQMPVCSGNTIQDATTAVLHAGQPIVIGGQGGGAVVIAGEGDPEGAIEAAVGSLFQRVDGSAGTSMSVKESGAGSTGWASPVTGLADGSVTNAKLANMAAASLKGSVAGGVPADLTASEATGLLDEVSTSAKGLAPTAPNDDTKFLRGDATWAVPASTGMFAFGASGLGTTASTVYLFEGFNNTDAATSTTTHRLLVPFNCELMGVYVLASPGTGTAVHTFTVVVGTAGVGNADSAYDVTCVGNALGSGASEDWSGSPLAIAAGQWLLIKVTKNTTMSAQATACQCAIAYRTT
jgi:hypothetical protein